MEVIRGVLGLMRAEAPADVAKMVVGLGNPGPEYTRSRHNIGFQVLELLSAQYKIDLSKVQQRARVGIGRIASGGRVERVIAVKPLTYMNASGEAVGPLLRYYRVPPAALIVVMDDLDLPIGRLRLRASGGSGGQKGMASIIRQLGSEDIPRLRVGIGRPPGKMEPADYVLQKFSPAQEVEMAEVRARAVEAIVCFFMDGIEAAMNRYNVADST
jgi:peptidyl-tRNA hydrolase, PTH1 family